MPISRGTCDYSKKEEGQLSTSKTICDNDRQLSISAGAVHKTKKDDRQLSTSRVTCDNTVDDGQLSSTKVASYSTNKDDEKLSTSEVTWDDTKQEDRQLPISHVKCDNTTIDKAIFVTAKTAEPIAESIGEPSAIVTSRDFRDTSQQKIALKRKRRRWSGLKRKRVSFAVRKGVKHRNVSKIGLTSKRPEIEESDSSEGRYQSPFDRMEFCSVMFLGGGEGGVVLPIMD